MGVSLEQYRSAIGIFNGGSHKDTSSGFSRSLYSDNISDRDSDSDSSQGSFICSNFFVAKGPWKLHVSAIVLLLFSLMTSMIAGSCHDLLLIRSGIESNPGPKTTEQIEKEKDILADLVNIDKEHCTADIRNCIRLFNPANTHDQHLSKFNGVRKGVLVNTLAYLGLEGMEQYLQKPLVNKVISAIRNHLPATCKTCTSEYCVELGERVLLACAKCGRGTHKDCVLSKLKITSEEAKAYNANDIQYAINPCMLPGIHYLCGECEGTVIPSPDEGKLKSAIKTPVEPHNHIQDTNTDDDLEETESSHSDDDHLNSSSMSIMMTGVDIGTSMTTNHERSSRVSFAETKPKVCHFYQKGTCKHGLSGRMGGNCPFAHPRPCPKLLNHGTKGPLGCNKGRDCLNFHPRMCHNSLRNKMCINTTCRFRHVKGTKRSIELKHGTNSIETDKTERIPSSQTMQNERQSSIDRSKTNMSDFLDALHQLKAEMLETMDQRFQQMSYKTHMLGTATYPYNTHGLGNQSARPLMYLPTPIPGLTHIPSQGMTTN